jgi:hypothetical protein
VIKQKPEADVLPGDNIQGTVTNSNESKVVDSKLTDAFTGTEADLDGSSGGGADSNRVNTNKKNEVSEIAVPFLCCILVPLLSFVKMPFYEGTSNPINIAFISVAVTIIAVAVSISYYVISQQNHIEVKMPGGLEIRTLKRNNGMPCCSKTSPMLGPYRKDEDL